MDTISLSLSYIVNTSYKTYHEHILRLCLQIIQLCEQRKLRDRFNTRSMRKNLYVLSSKTCRNYM